MRYVRRELKAISQEYRTLNDQDLEVDDLDEPLETEEALASVCGGLLVACNALDAAGLAAFRLRAR